MGANLDVSSATKLWSDEVEIMEKISYANLSPKSKGERQNTEEDLAACLSPSSTVNPKNSKTSVDDKEGAGQRTTISMMETGQGSQKGAGFIVGSKNKASAKKNINETVASSSDARVLAIIGSDQVEVSVGIQHGND
ncbi:hypothetical protein A4A49_18601 [Nicotiana attenuata]|uniref:Uncharacterized protein n=1 Tax=Nicotiana attenuata TaxID=49451 RepID=A0A314LGC9_NICAT|nr:hypothetical protein A4A49_18601 [Nicotiana attenuata]